MEKEKGMKRVLAAVVLGLAAIALMSGCSKQPTEAINAAKSSVDSLMAEGAEKYSAEDAKKIEGELNAAMDEVAAQDRKFFKNYGKADEMLAQVKANAEASRTALAQKKEQAKSEAAAALEQARSSVDEAKGLIEKAPKGKGTTADLEAMKTDLKGLEEGLAEVQKSIEGGDYLAATDKANAIKTQASAISQEINQAIAKVAQTPAKKAAAPKKKKKKAA